MKKHSIAALLLTLCTLLSMTACADNSTADSAPDHQTGSVSTDISNVQNGTQTVSTHSNLPESTAGSVSSTTVSTLKALNGTVQTIASQQTTAVQQTNSAQKTAVTQQTAATQQTTVPQQTVSRTTVTSPPDNTSVLLKEIQLPAKNQNITSIVSAGDNLAAVGTEGKCFLMDLAAGKMIAEIPMQKNYEQILGVNPDNTELITMTNGQEECRIRFYDIANGSCTGFDYSGQSYQFNYDRASDTIYGYSGSSVSRITRDGKETDIYSVSDMRDVSLRYNLYQKGLCVELVPGGEMSENDAVVRSIADGKEMFRVMHFASDYRACKNGLIRYETAFSSAKKQFVTNLAVYDWQKGKQTLACGVGEGECPSFYSDPESGYLLVGTKDSHDYHPTGLLMLDTQTGKTEKLNLQMKNAVDTICCYLPESGCWLCAVTSCKGEQYTSRLYCIDPTQAKFSTGKKSSYDIADALPKNIGSKLKKAREKADAIEKKYGIRVLIGNEINRLSSSSYYYISTEDTNSICYDAQCNGKPMEDALDALDSALARYPAGFFDNYRANGNKGLRISLLAAFASREYEIKEVAGLAFSDNQWQNVAICWDNLTPHDTTIHHEIFHTVESLLNERDYYYFVDDWNKLNPDGFLYNNSFVKSEYLLFNGEENPSAYFTREYGASAPHEDRACIVQFCFSNPKLDEGTSGYEFLQEYPNLKAKLDFIELRLRECFGKSYISEIFS